MKNLRASALAALTISLGTLGAFLLDGTVTGSEGLMALGAGLVAGFGTSAGQALSKGGKHVRR